jgi:hypothetical protein
VEAARTEHARRQAEIELKRFLATDAEGRSAAVEGGLGASGRCGRH